MVQWLLTTGFLTGMIFFEVPWMKINGWKKIFFPFGIQPIFQGIIAV